MTTSSFLLDRVIAAWSWPPCSLRPSIDNKSKAFICAWPTLQNAFPELSHFAIPPQGSRVIPISTDIEDWGLRTQNDLVKVSGLVSSGEVPNLQLSALSPAFVPRPEPPISAIATWWLDLSLAFL